MIKVKFLWDILRYFLATIASTIVTSLIPVIIASIPLIVALFWVIAWAVIIILALFGKPIDVPMDDPIGIVLVPLLASFLSAISISAIILLATSFNLVIVMPFGFIIELINKRLKFQNWFIRLGSFLSGGVILGFIVGIIGVLLAVKMNTDILGLIGIGVLLGITCIVAELSFGFILITADLIPKILKAGKRMFFPQSKNLAQQKNA